MIVCDTSGLIAYFDGSETQHPEIREAIDIDHGPFVISPFVLAELDYLMSARRGVKVALSMLGALTSGAWELASFDIDDVRQARGVIERYEDLNIGLTDASLVVLAARYNTNRLLTLDTRHFRAVRTMAGKAFELLPDTYI